MKKESTATLPVVTTEPATPTPYTPPRVSERRERISLADLLFPMEEGERGRRGMSPVAIMACAALMSAMGLLVLYSVSARLTGEWSWSAPWDVLCVLMQGGSFDPTPPPIPVGSGVDEGDPTGGTEPSDSAETNEEPVTGQPFEPSHGEETSAPPSDSETSGADTAPPDASADETRPTDEPITDSEESAPTVPAGMIAIAAVDKSEGERGASYVIRDGGAPDVSPKEGYLFAGEEAPAVLLIHSHPFEGYSDGGDWFDPTRGGLAQTESPYAVDGVVALGVALTRYLREEGITVIHLRVYAEEGETADAVYARVEGAVEEACSMYENIGLILDLRRSAELTDGGEILRTAGYYWGETCAQVGMTVHGNRGGAERALAIALALRSALWGTEPTLSRPVRLRGGEGVAPRLSEIPMITLEMGSAGNTFEEAERLVAPLGDALAWALWDIL